MKERLIEAINATIVPNDEKAITAESLANLLIEMVEAMGEGSGNEETLTFYTGKVDEEDGETLILTPEEKAHNAEMFKKFLASSFPPPIQVDVTGFFLAMEGTGYRAYASGMLGLYAPAGTMAEEEALLVYALEFGYVFLSDGSVMYGG